MKRGKAEKIKQKTAPKFSSLTRRFRRGVFCCPAATTSLRMFLCGVFCYRDVNNRFVSIVSMRAPLVTSPHTSRQRFAVCRLIFRTAPQMFHVKQWAPRVFRITALFHVKHLISVLQVGGMAFYFLLIYNRYLSFVGMPCGICKTLKSEYLLNISYIVRNSSNVIAWLQTTSVTFIPGIPGANILE